MCLVVLVLQKCTTVISHDFLWVASLCFSTVAFFERGQGGFFACSRLFLVQQKGLKILVLVFFEVFLLVCPA